MNTRADRNVWKRLREIDATTRSVLEAQRTTDLVTLIELKLHVRRFRDLADVIKLIRHNDLDESFSARLEPSSRPHYLECLDARRLEDQYPDWNLEVPE
jgi:hypothetical protein